MSTTAFWPTGTVGLGCDLELDPIHPNDISITSLPALLSLACRGRGIDTARHVTLVWMSF